MDPTLFFQRLPSCSNTAYWEMNLLPHGCYILSESSIMGWSGLPGTSLVGPSFVLHPFEDLPKVHLRLSADVSTRQSAVPPSPRSHPVIDPYLVNSLVFFLFLFLFLFFSRERERERERILSRLHVQCKAWLEARSHNPGRKPRAGRSTNWATQALPSLIL